jgi:type IX secretion system PorP/SprF family membrane protein
LYHNSWEDLKANDANDIELLNNPESAVLPAFSLGIYYYSRKYYFGISLPRFLTQEQDPSSGKYRVKNDYSQYQYFAAGGYTFDLGDKFSISPSCLLKYRPATPLQFDYTMQFSYSNRVQAGIGYRTKSVLIGILQCRINDQLKLAYSYDVDAGSLGKYKNGSHEIGLNYIFSYSAKVSGPRNL